MVAIKLADYNSPGIGPCDDRGIEEVSVDIY